MQVLQKLNLHNLSILKGSCSPNAIPTFNGPNAIRNIQMIFITKTNHHSNEKSRTIPTLSGSNAPLKGVGNS
jgi:hypothetical protein